MISNFYKEITIVIISFHSKNKVKNFISKLSNNFKIIVIENSEDKILKSEIKKEHENVDIYLVKNKGYAGSINYARSFINTKYFFIFNPDVNNINDEKIKIFYDKARVLNDNFGCLGPRYLNIDAKTLVQSDKDKEIGEMKAISGAAMFFNKKIFDLNEGFDGNFFLYFEENDYCKRSKKNGYRTFQLNNCNVLHERGSSAIFENNLEKRKYEYFCTWHFIWSKFYFFKKHYGFFFTFIYFAPILLRIIFRISLYKVKNDKENIKKYKIRLFGLINSVMGRKSFQRMRHFG